MKRFLNVLLNVFGWSVLGVWVVLGFLSVLAHPIFAVSTGLFTYWFYLLMDKHLKLK